MKLCPESNKDLKARTLRDCAVSVGVERVTVPLGWGTGLSLLSVIWSVSYLRSLQELLVRLF